MSIHKLKILIINLNRDDFCFNVKYVLSIIVYTMQYKINVGGHHKFWGKIGDMVFDSACKGGMMPPLQKMITCICLIGR